MTIYLDVTNNTQDKRLSRIRKAADGVTSVSCADDIILEKLEKSDRWIDVQTGKAKESWSESDDEWETVLEASENRTASQLSGILKETHDELVTDYRNIVKALNKKDSEIQSTTMSPISEGVNITNELDPDVYTPEQTAFTND